MSAEVMEPPVAVDFSSELRDIPEFLAGDASSLSRPVLVAAGNAEDVATFARLWGLTIASVRRVKSWGDLPAHLPRSKVLVLLPGWWQSRSTDDLVHRWVEGEDRWTVEVGELPAERAESALWAFAYLVAAMACTLCSGWQMWAERSVVAGIPWGLAVAGFALAGWEHGSRREMD